MRLIKLNTEHFIIVDDSEIKEGDWYFCSDKTFGGIGKHTNQSFRCNNCKKITHTTHVDFIKTETISLSAVKELIGEVDVHKKADEMGFYDSTEDNKGNITTRAFIAGYNQATEDNKEKKYTEEDMKKAFKLGQQSMSNHNIPLSFEYNIQSLQPKTEWDVEFVNGKLKLKQNEK